MSKPGSDHSPHKAGSHKVEPIQILSASKSEDVTAAEILEQIFPREELSAEASADAAQKAVSVLTLPDHLEQWMEDESRCKNVPDVASQPSGILGPSDCIYQFDIRTNVGTLIVDQDRLGLCSQGNFSSMRANCCVYKGKWMFEVMLGSKGVMQVGWCTVRCKFSLEEGVGDTPDSYSYDGNRQRKWNKTTQKYGEMWCTGDVITCTIDCDEGKIAFYRNGKSLGEAFSSLRLGTGFAYFPAVSLSHGENLRANFGATPLKYPLEGFSPLQTAPTGEVIKTNLLLEYLEKLLYMDLENDPVAELAGGKVAMETKPPPLAAKRSKKTSLMLIVSQVFEKLAHFLKSSYVIEECLVKLLLQLNDLDIIHGQNPRILRLLDYMWAFMQGFELKYCLESLMLSLLSGYRFAPSSTDFKQQREYLTVVLAIMNHQTTRRYLLEHLELFEKLKFPMFLHIKPLDDKGLEEIAPQVWWDMNVQDEDDVENSADPEDEKRKEKYLHSCETLRQKTEEIERLQIEILKVLLCHGDLSEGKTSRLLFLEMLRKFIRENRTVALTIWPLPVALCFFHRLVRVLRYYWDTFQEEDPARFVLSEDAFMPIQEFWSDSREYWDLQRCGGSMGHLNRILGAEVNKAQGLELSDDGQVKELNKPKTESEYPPTEMPSGNTLMEMLDGVMLLYNVAAHKQLSKMNVLKENIQEFIQSYKDTMKKLDSCPIEMTEVRDELVRAKTVFIEKITEQARQICWIRAVVYSQQKQKDLAWLLKTSMRTVKKASQYKLLFQYMPEFYLEIVIHTHMALKNYFQTYVCFETLDDYNEIMSSFAMFLVKHFSDSRIVIVDTRDTIIQALACFTCYEKSLKILESLPVDVCTQMLRHLIAPYESRSWAQTNWILVRIWKGCGFGFRYTHLPHLVPSKVQLTEFGSASLQKPCPSPKFQSLLADLLHSEPDLATRFIDTLLNQLNWSFSEFIGIMQEIQQVLSRMERKIFLESRQLKICGTCFEISVCLFRVVEMVVAIAPTLFTDWSKPSAELLLHRLIQLTCLVLSRITQKNGMFDSIVSLYITGLESVTHYPMLSVVAGILTTLISKSDSDCQKLVTKLLLSDAGFQLSAIEFMLGNHGDDKEQEAGATASPKKSKEKPFDFRNFQEVSGEEIAHIELLLSHLSESQKTFVHLVSEIHEDDLCQICYANKNSTVFKPCGHHSCRSCIDHQLLNKKECFFCKSVVNSIEALPTS
ncbi:E3 ubiquitin-protein ligase RNF123-like [Mya arenaria]|uniref:E3 ubiquitin-protein ligase RNF123-like n=1 Tax=Mya arenaria TaxID=6604 RepID=UPI0022E4A351|nr:E3 ubiquitin-protein ligase RNF123-like [Mya arenaria]